MEGKGDVTDPSLIPILPLFLPQFISDYIQTLAAPGRPDTRAMTLCYVTDVMPCAKIITQNQGHSHVPAKTKVTKQICEVQGNVDWGTRVPLPP